jgi:quercetin 2,3-dioxygenase
MTHPRYHDISSDTIPEVTDDDGTHVRVISGDFWGRKGPVKGIAVDPMFIDVWVPPSQGRRLKVETTHNAFGFVFEGSGTFRDASAPRPVLTEDATDPYSEPAHDVNNHPLVLFDRGDEIKIQASPEGMRFLLVSGKPLRELVAWYGSIVMNTEAELRQAIAELNSGTFIKNGRR